MKKNIVINVDNQMDLILYLWGIQFVNPAKIIATIEAAFNKDYEIVGQYLVWFVKRYKGDMLKT
jgi:hypothetical protein